jgi:hypothetical protein
MEAFIILLLTLFGWVTQQSPQITAATPPPVCAAPPRLDVRELRQLFELGDIAFADSAWQAFNVQEAAPTISMTWYNPELGSAVAHLEYLIWGCGEPNLTEYFSDWYFQTVLTNFEPIRNKITCQFADVTLTEFDGTSTDNQVFILRVWYQQTDSHRVRVTQLFFPVRWQAELDSLSAIFYPELPFCPEES